MILFLMVLTWMCFFLVFFFQRVTTTNISPGKLWVGRLFFLGKGSLFRGHAGTYGMHQNLVVDGMFPMGFTRSKHQREQKTRMARLIPE